jgi:hypothetical protein
VPALLGLTGVSGACRPAPDPIRVEGRAVVVENRSDEAWRDVEVWVNDHYRVSSPVLAARGRFVAPLDTFVAGFGQRFDGRRQRIRGIEVTARTQAGRSVRLVWGAGRRR